MKGNLTDNIVKLVGYVIAAIVALWLLGVVFKLLGSLFIGLVGLLQGLLGFLITAAIVGGVVYLLVTLLKKK